MSQATPSPPAPLTPPGGAGIVCNNAHAPPAYSNPSSPLRSQPTVSRHTAHLKECFNAFSNPVFTYDDDTYHLPREMQHSPPYTFFDDLWRFGKTGREGDLEAQQEDLLSIIERLGQGLREEREVERVVSEVCAAQQSTSRLPSSQLSVYTSPLLTHASTTNPNPTFPPSSVDSTSDSPPPGLVSSQNPRSHAASPRSSLPPETPMAPLIELETDASSSREQEISPECPQLECNHDAPLLATLPSLALLYPSSSFDDDNENEIGNDKLASSSTVQPASIRASTSTASRQLILDAAFSSKHASPRNIARSIPTVHRHRAGSDPIPTRSTASELYRRCREISLPIRIKHPFLPRNLTYEPSARVNTAAFSFSDMQRPSEFRPTIQTKARIVEDERDPLDLLADVAGTQYRSEDQVSALRSLPTTCPFTPSRLLSRHSLLSKSSTTVASSPSSRDTWDDTDDEAPRYGYKGKDSQTVSPRSVLAARKTGRSGAKYKSERGPDMSKDDKQAVMDMIYLQQGAGGSCRQTGVTSGSAHTAIGIKRSGGTLAPQEWGNETLDASPSSRATKRSRTKGKGSMRAILEGDAGVPTCSRSPTPDVRQDSLFDQMLSPTGAMSRYREVYGLLKGAKPVSGPRQPKMVLSAYKGGKSLVPAESKKRSRIQTKATSSLHHKAVPWSKGAGATSVAKREADNFTPPSRKTKTGISRVKHPQPSLSHETSGSTGLRPENRRASQVKQTIKIKGGLSNRRTSSSSEDPLALKDSEEDPQACGENVKLHTVGRKANGGDGYTREEDNKLWREWNGERPLGPEALERIREAHHKAGYGRTKEAIKWRIHLLVKRRGAPRPASRRRMTMDRDMTDDESQPEAAP